jgi:hypothetical protein
VTLPAALLTRRRRAVAALAAALLALPLALSVGGEAPLRAAGEQGRFAWVETLDRGDHYRLVVGSASGQVDAVLAPQTYGRAAFSPDGQRIAFSAPVGDGSLGRYALHVVDVDGTDLRRLTQPAIGDFDPAWSPDSTRIVVSRNERGNYEPTCCTLWLIGANGQGDVRLHGANSASQPAFSPDGGQIAYTHPEGIRAVPVQGGASRLVVAGALTWPAFSPDGQTIAAVRKVAPEAGTVSLFSQAGGAVSDTAAGNGGGLPEAPVFSDASTLLHLNVWGLGEDGRTRAEVRRTVIGGETSVVFGTGRPMYYLDWSGGWRHGLPEPQGRPIDDSCPPEEIEEDGFVDVPPDNVHEAAIDCVVHWQISTGQTPATYAPGGAVTREQMATFLTRSIRRSGGTLPEPTGDRFSDDDASVHEDSINALAGAGIVNGVAPGRYAPATGVTRAQMAAFLTRAYDYRAQQSGSPLLGEGEDYFYDDQGATLEPAINKAAEAGFTGGVGDGRYAPGLVVRRDQMASFLARVLDLAVERGMAQVPPPPEDEPSPSPSAEPSPSPSAAG